MGTMHCFCQHLLSMQSESVDKIYQCAIRKSLTDTLQQVKRGGVECGYDGHG